VAKKKMGDVVVVLPGIMGSELEQNGKALWALSGGALWRALTSLGSNLQALTLPPGDGTPADGIVATRLMPDVQIIPGLWKVDGYDRLARFVADTFEVTEGENFFPFPYDWRRDNRIAARMLKEQADGWLERWRASSGNGAARLVLLAHSMGGLVARYFLEVLGGWKQTRALITFGTPYRGSLNALGFLVNGFEKKVGPFKVIELTDMLRSFTSIYQLLPIFPCLHPAAGAAPVRLTEGPVLPGMDGERVKQARAFHDEIQAAAARNRTDESYHRAGYVTHPVVGIRQPTRQSARWAAGALTLLDSYDGGDNGGDGTVPRVSATPIELSNDHREIFASETHGSLQNADDVIVQVEGALSAGALDLDRFRGGRGGPLLRPTLGAAAAIELGLSVPDSLAQGEPLIIRARSGRAVDLRATVIRVDEPALAIEVPLARRQGEWHEVEVAPLAPGDYRVRVAGDARTVPVTDVLTVVADT
jgi:pimeloyl-ACP methyl ester carboxylesterase